MSRRCPSSSFRKGKPIKATSEVKTLNNRLSVLAKLLRVAYDWQRIPEIPCRIRLLKVDNSREASFYEHDVYAALVLAARKCDRRVYAAVLLAGDAGLRRGEVIALDQADVDHVRAKLNVCRSVYWKKGHRFVRVPKGGKGRWVPCTPRLLAAVCALRHLRGSRLLYTDDGKELTPKIMRRWVEAVERRAGLHPTGRMHIFRHTFCSHLAMAGVPARTIMELAGHADIATTLRYMHLSPAAVEDGISTLVRSREQGGKAVTTRGNMVATASAETKDSQNLDES